MPWILPGVLVGALFALFLYARRAVASDDVATVPDNPTLRSIYERAGARYHVDPDLLQAIAIQESNERPNAIRWNPPNDVSVGLMQILATPPQGMTRERADAEDYLPTNRFNLSGWPVSYLALHDPELNVDFGARILASNLQIYGYPRGVAVYNRWASRNEPVNGPFTNQDYVDRVARNLAAIKGI